MSCELQLLGERMRGLAAARGGVVTATECRRLGADPTAIRTLVGSGDWHRARRGIYRDAHFRPPPADPDHHQRCAALLAGLSGPAVVSHLSAVRLLGLPLPPRAPSRAGITRRPPAPTNDPLLGDVHVTDYDDADVRVLGGVPVLAGARLVLDCCTELAPESALALADAALARGLTTHDEPVRQLDRWRGRPGSRAASAVVDRADAGAESWFESVSRWWLLEAGLPRPVLQEPFHHRGVRARVDLWFPEQRTVGEADGAGKYDEPGALFAEKRREDWLRDVHQVEVVRWVPPEMRTPAGRAEVVARFRRAFGRRS